MRAFTHHFWTRLAALLSFFVGTTDPREQIIEALDETLKRNNRHAYKAIVIVAEIDGFHDLRRQSNGKDIRRILRTLEVRLKGDLLRHDVVRRLDGDQFAIAISPLRNLSRAEMLDLAVEIQACMASPIHLGNGAAQITMSIGCAMSQGTPNETGEDLLEAARTAQVEAAKQGDAMIRIYSDSMKERINARRALLTDALNAIKSGDIQAYFQPQLCLSTQQVSGVEALARWNHKVRGLISPAEFLPILEEAGMMRHLGLAMLRDSLRALRHWDDADVHVPHVSVNMSAYELRDPNLVDIIQLELDAFDLSPDRLVIEILETVVAQGTDDPIIRNLHAISDVGCSIDLDDFGTGHAAITTIKNYAVNRIKIDRSFVTHVDHDENQQQMVNAILLVAQGLSIETLAEGVETDLEIRHMAQTGCGHAQGFAIARPLPPAETLDWLRDYQHPADYTQRSSYLH